MRKIAIALLALATAGAATAQTRPAVPAAAATGAAADLRCAVWAVFALAANRDKAESQRPLSMALTWFIGHYEGETGKKFEDALTSDYINRVGPELGTAEKGCTERAQQMGDRLTAWGQKMQASAAAEKPAAPAPVQGR